jgi:hypothetical protein
MAEIKQYGHPRFYELLEQMAELHSRKNHDYADQADPLSNFKEVAGATGVTPFTVIRMFLATKMARIKQLSVKENLVIGESIRDSLLDLAIYALLGIISLEEADAKSRVDKKK